MMVSRGFRGNQQGCDRLGAKKYLLGGGVSPPNGNFDNFIFKMVQSGAFWRFYLC